MFKLCTSVQHSTISGRGSVIFIKIAAPTKQSTSITMLLFLSLSLYLSLISVQSATLQLRGPSNQLIIGEGIDNVTFYQTAPRQVFLKGQLLLRDGDPTSDAEATHKKFVQDRVNQVRIEMQTQVDVLAALITTLTGTLEAVSALATNLTETVQQQAQTVTNLTEKVQHQAKLIANLSSSSRLDTLPAQKHMFKAINGSGTWTVPDGVTQVRMKLSGGGGGGGSGRPLNGINGGASTLGALTAEGGQGGITGYLSSDACTVGGNLRGAPGGPGGVFYGADGNTGSCGCPGVLLLQLLTVTPGESLEYTIGAGGAGDVASGVNGAKGGDGYLVLEWEE